MTGRRFELGERSRAPNARRGSWRAYPLALGLEVEPFVPLGLPPMFGQLPFGWVVPSDGVVDGVVVDGVVADDGSGLAAQTADTPPTARRPAARMSVATIRRTAP